MDLPKIFNNLNARLAEAKVWDRRIERERLMTDLDKIVLVDDFESCFGSIGTLSRLRWDNRLLIGVEVRRAPPFVLPKTLLSPERRKLFEDRPKISAEELERMRPMGWEMCPDKRIYKNLGDDRLAAHYLGHLIQAWDNALYGQFWNFGKLASLFKSEGREVEAFWQRVNTAPDYSALFPRRPPRTGHGARREHGQFASPQSLAPLRT